MSRLGALGIALVLMLISLPLVSLGAADNLNVVGWLGLLSLIVGGLIPPITRYALPAEDDAD